MVPPRRAGDERRGLAIEIGKSVAVYLNGLGIPDLDARGQRVTDDSFVLCFNAHHEPINFVLPPPEFGPAWIPVLDTAQVTGSRQDW